MKNNIIIHFPFNDELTCEYNIDGKEKTFKRSPIAMAELLKKYGFIDEYKVMDFTMFGEGKEVYVWYSPTDEGQQFDSIEEFVSTMGVDMTRLFIAAFESEGFNREQTATETAKVKDYWSKKVSHE